MDDSRTQSAAITPGAPAWITVELIEHTIRVWQPYYADPLTASEALAIINSTSRLIEALSREPLP
jgi:hypothetical protein